MSKLEEVDQEKIPKQDRIEILNEKLDAFYEVFRDKSVVIGYTGGLGSTVLMKLAQRVAKDLKCVFVETLYTSRNDKRAVENYMQKDDLKEAGAITILVRPEINKDIMILNPEDRDFFCKKGISDALLDYCEKINFDFVADGTYLELFDKLWGGKDRLGDKYVMIFGDFKLKYDDLKLIAEKNNINFSRPPEINMLSRFAYKIPITEALMESLKDAEDYIAEISGASVIRARVLDPDHIVIECKRSDLPKLLNEENREKIYVRLKAIGFKSIAIDLAGYRPHNMIR